jgi:hypothetical protein
LRDSSFFNNTCYIEGPGGAVYEGNPSGGGHLVRNIVLRNNVYKIQNNLFFKPGSVGQSQVFSSDSTFAPVFAGNFTSATATPSDYRLASGSPGINQGANLSSVFTTDFAGVPRGSTYDMGAYEYVGSSGITRPSSPVNLQVSR